MTEAYICDAIRTPIGRYGGALSRVRTDDLAAVPIRALVEATQPVEMTEQLIGSVDQVNDQGSRLSRG